MPSPTISCDPNDLMAAAKCFKCIPGGMQNEVIIYLLANILNAETGASMEPSYLMEKAKCFKCIPAGMQAEVETYLLCQIAQSVGT